MRTLLQRHNGKFEAEYDVRDLDGYEDALKKELGLESLLISCSITSMHHATRAQARAAVKKAMAALVQRLIDESKGK